MFKLVEGVLLRVYFQGALGASVGNVYDCICRSSRRPTLRLLADRQRGQQFRLLPARRARYGLPAIRENFVPAFQFNAKLHFANCVASPDLPSQPLGSFSASAALLKQRSTLSGKRSIQFHYSIFLKGIFNANQTRRFFDRSKQRKKVRARGGLESE